MDSRTSPTVDLRTGARKGSKGTPAPYTQSQRSLPTAPHRTTLHKRRSGLAQSTPMTLILTSAAPKTSFRRAAALDSSSFSAVCTPDPQFRSRWRADDRRTVNHDNDSTLSIDLGRGHDDQSGDRITEGCCCSGDLRSCTLGCDVWC